MRKSLQSSALKRKQMNVSAIDFKKSITERTGMEHTKNQETINETKKQDQQELQEVTKKAVGFF